MSEDVKPTEAVQQTIDPFASVTSDSKPTEAEAKVDHAAELIGEGKAYPDTDAAAKALAHGQAHIAKIEAENKEFRERLTQLQQAQEQQKTVKDMIAEAIQQQDSASVVVEQVDGTNGTSNSLTPEQVKSLVSEQLQQSSREQQMVANQKQVSDYLISVYGTQAQKVTADAASAAGMSVGELKRLSMTHPKVVMQMMSGSAPNASPASNDAGSAAPSASLPKGQDLHGLPKAHSIRPPAGTYNPTPLRGGDGKSLVDAWRESYPAEQVEAMRKQGLI